MVFIPDKQISGFIPDKPRTGFIPDKLDISPVIPSNIPTTKLDLLYKEPAIKGFARTVPPEPKLRVTKVYPTPQLLPVKIPESLPKWQIPTDLGIRDESLRLVTGAVAAGMSPVYFLISEGIQQLKNVMVGKIKGEKYDPLEIRQVSELWSKNTPEIIKIASSIGEIGTDLLSGAVLTNLYKHGVLAKTVNTVANKLQAKGWNPEQVNLFRNQMGQYVKDVLSKTDTPERATTRLINAIKFNAPAAAARMPYRPGHATLPAKYVPPIPLKQGINLLPPTAGVDIITPPPVIPARIPLPAKKELNILPSPGEIYYPEIKYKPGEYNLNQLADLTRDKPLNIITLRTEAKNRFEGEVGLDAYLSGKGKIRINPREYDDFEQYLGTKLAKKILKKGEHNLDVIATQYNTDEAGLLQKIRQLHNDRKQWVEEQLDQGSSDLQKEIQYGEEATDEYYRQLYGDRWWGKITPAQYQSKADEIIRNANKSAQAEISEASPEELQKIVTDETDKITDTILYDEELERLYPQEFKTPKITTTTPKLKPAFMDIETGTVYPTDLFHDISQLPEPLQQRIVSGRPGLDKGMMDETGKFLTAEQALAKQPPEPRQTAPVSAGEVIPAKPVEVPKPILEPPIKSEQIQPDLITTQATVPAGKVKPVADQVEARRLLEEFDPEPATQPEMFPAGKVGERGSVYLNIPDDRTAELGRRIKYWFSRGKGVPTAVDKLNEKRLGQINADIFEADANARNLRKWADKQNSESADQLLELTLKGELPIEDAPIEIRNSIIQTRNHIDGVSAQLAEYAPTEVIKEKILSNLGRYLVRSFRVYEQKDFTPKPEVIQNAKELFRRKFETKANKYAARIEKAQSRGQADPEYITKLEDMQDYYNKLAAQSEAQMDTFIRSFLEKRNRVAEFSGRKVKINIPQNHFIKRQDIDKEIRDLFGEIHDAPWLYVKTIADNAVVAHNGQFFDKIAQIPGVAYDTPPLPKGYFQITPDTKSWGALAGKYVNQEVYDFITGDLRFGKDFLVSALNNYLINPFKWVNTVGNLPTHGRNLFGNTFFSLLNRNFIGNPANWGNYAKAVDIWVNRYGTTRAEWKGLIERRIAGTQYVGGEIFQRNELEKLYKNQELWASTVTDKIKQNVSKGIDFAGEIYNFEDLLFKIAADIKNREVFKMTPTQSAEVVNKLNPNYARLPRVVELLRSGLGTVALGPFVSFKASVGVILKDYTAMLAKGEYTTGIPIDRSRGIITLLTVLGIPFLLEKSSKTLFDVDETAEQELKKIYPIYRRNVPLVYFRDKAGKLRAFDFAYIWPTGDLVDLTSSISKGDFSAASRQIITNPALDLYTIWKEGRIPQLGYEIGSPYDKLSKQLLDRIENTIKIYIPPITPIPNIGALAKGEGLQPGLFTGRQAKNIINAINQTSDRYGRVRDLPAELVAGTAGLRTWRVYPEVLQYQKISQLKFELQDEKRKYTIWQRNNPLAAMATQRAKSEEHQSRINNIMKQLYETFQIDTAKLDKRK